MKPKRTFLGLHHCKLYALTFLLVMGCINSFAQTGSKAVKVTISPKSGNIISTRSESALEAGSEGGYGSLFIHNQAPLTYTTTDQPVFSADGLMRNHTGNIRFYDHNTTSIDDEGWYTSQVSLTLSLLWQCQKDTASRSTPSASRTISKVAMGRLTTKS